MCRIGYNSQTILQQPVSVIADRSQALYGIGYDGHRTPRRPRSQVNERKENDVENVPSNCFVADWEDKAERAKDALAPETYDLRAEAHCIG